MWRKIKATPLIKKGVVVERFNVPTWVSLKVGQSVYVSLTVKTSVDLPPSHLQPDHWKSGSGLGTKVAPLHNHNYKEVSYYRTYVHFSNCSDI